MNWLAWCDNDPSGNGDEVDTFPLTGGQTYCIEVNEWDYEDGTFNLRVSYP